MVAISWGVKAGCSAFRLAISWQETAPRVSRLGTLFGKEGTHPLLLKPLSLIVQGAFTCSDFFGAFSRRLAKQNDGAQPFILLLFRPERILLDLLPIMGTFSALPLAGRHDDRLFCSRFSLLTDMSVCPDKSNVHHLDSPRNSHFGLLSSFHVLFVFYRYSSFTRMRRVQQYVPPS
jgi:hypothetical protein